MLALKHLSVKSFNEAVAYVHKDCNVYKVDDIQTLTRIEVHGGSQPIAAFLNIVDDTRLVKPGELGLNEEAFDRLNLPEGSNVSIVLTDPPQSFEFVNKKIFGNALTANEYKSIIKDINEGKYANIDIASFLTACNSFITAPEIADFAAALSAKEQIQWDEEDIVVDCHTFGDVPGNNTDIIITSIVAAYGLPIPKTVVPNPQSCYGEANAMKVFTNINQNEVSLRALIRENRGAVVNFKSLAAASAIDTLQTVGRYLTLKDVNLKIVYLLAMKRLAGITHLVIDIPVGPKTLAKTAQDAINIRKKFEYAGNLIGMTVDAVVTDGREPVGSGIGAVLEAKDVLKILRGKEDAPKDLKEKALFLAGRVLEFDPKMRGGQGYAAAAEILSSGRALEAFNSFVFAQGEPLQLQNDLGNLQRDVLAPASGKIKSIDNKKINKIGIFAGAIQYPGAGLYLLKKVGDMVHKGDVLYRIHACNSADYALVNSFIEADNGYEISK